MFVCFFNNISTSSVNSPNKIKIIIDSNPDYKRYLRTNSYWYKILNRNPFLIDDFIREVKEKYKLRTTDKINDIMELGEL